MSNLGNELGEVFAYILTIWFYCALAAEAKWPAWLFRDKEKEKKILEEFRNEG